MPNKITFELTGQASDALAYIKKETYEAGPGNQAVSRALAVYAAIMQAQARGDEIRIKPDGKTRTAPFTFPPYVRH